MIKKFLLCICVCCLFVGSIYAKTRYGGKYMGKVVSAEQDDEENYVLKQEAKENVFYEAKENVFYIDKLKRFRKYYVDGDFKKAEECVDEILLTDPNDEKAGELKSKLLLLREKENFYRKMLLEDYYAELKRSVKDNNYYEGFLYIKKIKSLIPEQSSELLDILNSFNDELTKEQELFLSAFENEKDKKIFLDSVEAFLNEKYQKSAKLIYKLYNKYPKFGDFVGMSRYYATVNKNNSKRIKVLYNKALKYFKAGRLGQAKTCAQMAHNLDSESMRLKLLIEQIDMEMI